MQWVRINLKVTCWNLSTLRHRLCTKWGLEAAQIKKIRENVKVSQPVFAVYLNTSESTIQKWEAGTKKPSGMALKLLTIVEKHGLQVLA